MNALFEELQNPVFNTVDICSPSLKITVKRKCLEFILYRKCMLPIHYETLRSQKDPFLVPQRTFHGKVLTFFLGVKNHFSLLKIKIVYWHLC